MNLYCPKCWGINDWGRETCAHCGAPLRGPEGETYAQKLIWALHHREATTALRAATLLGKLRAAEATYALAGVLREPATDPYVGAAAARSLGAIGDERARTVLIEALGRGPVSVRLAAVEALAALGPEEDTARALRRALEDRSANVSAAAREILEGPDGREWRRLGSALENP